jgi:hypothetical protein
MCSFIECFWFLLFNNSILSKSRIEQPIICFCMFCSIQDLFCWNLSFAGIMLYLCLSQLSILQLWTHISTQYHHYTICQNINCWCSVDAQIHNRLSYMLCTVLVEKDTITSYINYYQKATLWLPKMQDQESVMFHWCWCLRWRREHVAIIVAPTVSNEPWQALWVWVLVQTKWLPNWQSR